MDVKEAVQTAKEHVVHLFEGEQIVNVGLEEVEFEETSKRWRITIGFSRPWDLKGPLVAALVERSPTQRTYKVLRIDDDTGNVESLKDRLLKASE